MIGERLKLKRHANQLSLRDLTHALEKSGISVTKGTLSNYETERIVPDDGMLRALALELGTSVEFLRKENPPRPDLVILKTLDKTMKETENIRAYIQLTLENRLEIDRVLGIRSQWKIPQRIHISQGQEDQVEAYAEEIRSQWGLDQYPISSVINLLEKQEWDVFELPKSFGLSGVVGYDSKSSVPFVYCPTPAGVVNVRMQILQQVAYAYFTAESEELMEQVARRFAGCILFTKQQAFREFGKERKAITSMELTLAKQKYGLPKYEVMGRLEQLGIISPSLFRSYMNKIREQGYPSNRDTMSEPLFFFENSSEYSRKMQLAFAEKRIGSEVMIQRQTMMRTYSE